MVVSIIRPLRARERTGIAESNRPNSMKLLSRHLALAERLECALENAPLRCTPADVPSDKRALRGIVTSFVNYSASARSRPFSAYIYTSRPSFRHGIFNSVVISPRELEKAIRRDLSDRHVLFHCLLSRSMRSPDINLRSRKCVRIHTYTCIYVHTHTHMYICNICVNVAGSQTGAVHDAISGQTREYLIGWEETESYVNLSCIHSILSPYRISARNGGRGRRGRRDIPKTWKGKVANLCVSVYASSPPIFYSSVRLKGGIA